jgi:hypothetical protein
MLKTFAAALIAASMLTIPALAQGGGTSAPAAHHKMTKHSHARHHVKHVRHVRHGRHHVGHASVKRTHAVHVARHAPKVRTN